MTQATRTPEVAARQMLSTLTLDGLLRAFEATISTGYPGSLAKDYPELPQVRGWLMDELEARNATAFGLWLESTEDSPRRFYGQCRMCRADFTNTNPNGNGVCRICRTEYGWAE